MAFLAAIEVDQRQRIVTSVDKLKEMLGGSWAIEETKSFASETLKASGNKVQPIRAASGDIWIRADKLADLEACLWEFRKEIVDEFRLPCSFAVVDEGANPAEARDRLQRKIRQVKDGKAGEMGHVSLPWLAPCRIQPEKYSNHWRNKPDHQNQQRKLISADSNARLKRGRKTLRNYYKQFPIIQERRMKEPESLGEFAPQRDDSYLAVIRLDADNASHLFKNIPLGSKPEYESWKPLLECSEAFGNCLTDAMKTAFRETVVKAAESGLLDKDKTVPISPLIAAGDDFLIVTRKELAMPFTLCLMSKYRELAANDKILKRHRKEDDPPLTLSGSILYARAGFPFSVLSELSVEVEQSAKKLRKSTGITDPCLDVYWLESTGRESAISSRDAQLSYKIGETIYSLNTRPWTLTQAIAMHKAAAQIGDIPRGKWHQLLEGLWQGKPVGRFHYGRWLHHLSGQQRNRMSEATKLLTECGKALWNDSDAPWVEAYSPPRLITPLLELHQLHEMAGGIDIEPPEPETR